MWLGSLLALGLLAAGVVGAAALLWEHVDIRQIAPELAEGPPSPPTPVLLAPAARPAGEFSVALLRTPPNRDVHPDATWHSRALDRWRSVVEGIGGRVRQLEARDLDQLAPDELLLAPEATCLTPGQIRTVERHLAGGGGVVANGAFGARDGACTWVGWQAVSRLAASPDIREIPAREDLYLTLPDGVPLAAGLPPGTRIGLRGDPVLARGDTGARAFWSDWAMNPAPETGGPDGAAVALRTPGGGRVAWFGFRLGQAATPADALLLRRVVENGILWAAARPQAGVAAWPTGHRAALVPVVEVESEPRNALEVARVLGEEQVPGTFFVVSGLVSDDGELASALSAVGEIAAQTVDHSPLQGRTLRDQMATLRRTRREVAGWAGTPPTGLRPPEEGFDPWTISAWAGEGGRYLVALNEARSASPELHVQNGDTAVVIPRLVKDDYNVVVQEASVRSTRLTEAWTAGLEKIGALGGVAVVAGHTQILRSPGRLEAWRQALRSATEAGDWWLATGSQVDRWWRDRARIRVRWVGQGGGAPPSGAGTPASGPSRGEAAGDTLRLEVELMGGEPVDAAVWIDVVLPGHAGQVEPWVDDEPVVSVATPHGLRLPVGALVPGEPRTVRLVTGS